MEDTIGMSPTEYKRQKSAASRRSPESLSHWEHLGLELARAELLVRMALLRYPPRLSAEIEQYKGLFISDEEVELLLQQQLPPDDPERIAELEQQLHELESHLTDRIAASKLRELPLEQLRLRAGLQRETYVCLILLIAIELERRYEKLYAYLQDDVTCKYMTPDLALKLIARNSEAETHLLEAFHPHSMLWYWLLKRQPEQEQPFRSRIMRLEPQVLAYILHPHHRSEAVHHNWRIYIPDDISAPPVVQSHIQEELQRCYDHRYGQASSHSDEEESTTDPLYRSGSTCYIAIGGKSGSGRRYQLRYLYHTQQRELLYADLNRLEATSEGLEESLRSMIREAWLHDADLVLDGWQEWHTTRPRELYIVYNQLDRHNGIVWLLHHHTAAVTDQDMPWRTERTVMIQPLHREEAQHFWSHIGAQLLPSTVLDWERLAATFQLTPGQMEMAMRQLKDESSSGSLSDQPNAVQERLHHICYQHIRTRLHTHATRISGTGQWEQLILPVAQKQMLRYACDQVKHRQTVYETWGLSERVSYGKGLSLLLTGPPGTGKTMSARVIAAELQMEMYQIDLSRVVSKYIGETEKHLQEIFDEAKHSSSILFFDEADALFGKRSEVSDSHDRFANMETSFLLQKMEEYEGITVLATNYRQNLDDAFMRRIHFIVRFPFPDQNSRRQIWISMMPAQLPREDDLDIDFLAEHFELSGGQIKNIVVMASFLAAAENTKVSMSMLLTALRLELEKGGMIVTPDTFGMYADLWSPV